MKTKLVSNDIKKEFVPFKVELEVESIEEARLLFHVFNHTDLLAIIKEDPKYNFIGSKYVATVSKNPCNYDSDKNIFETQILNQGYEI